MTQNCAHCNLCCLACQAHGPLFTERMSLHLWRWLAKACTSLKEAFYRSYKNLLRSHITSFISLRAVYNTSRLVIQKNFVSLISYLDTAFWWQKDGKLVQKLILRKLWDWAVDKTAKQSCASAASATRGCWASGLHCQRVPISHSTSWLLR